MKNKKLRETTIKEALVRIINSKTFSGSNRNIEILQFLTDCYLNDIPLKEAVLGMELFKDSNPAESNEGKVRVYMYNLRKKLEEYYRTEGAYEKIIFTIQKGQYNLSVEERENAVPLKDPSSYKIVSGVLAGITILLGILLVKPNFSSNYLWQTFFSDKAAVTCCIGDHFTVVGKSADGRRMSSYLQEINSETDFEQFIKSLPPGQNAYSQAPFSFVTKMGPVCAAELSGWFTKNNKELNIVVEAEISPDKLNNSNIVYIGPYSTMHAMRGLFLKDSKVFAISGLDIIDKSSGEKLKTQFVNNIRKDYVIVSFVQLNDLGKSILFFAGNNDIGVQSAVKNFTNRKWLKDFYRNIPGKQKYFNALFEVRGIGRTELQCELVKIELLN